MAIEQVLHMNGGAGDTSYANNSAFQKKVMSKAIPILEESITRLYCTILPKCLKVADLGCSSGPNALLVASNIVNIVDATSVALSRKPPVFQFFLNDLFGNDFNTIFMSLPVFYRTLQEEKGNEFGPCLISATPGSFYGRLFPNNSIHFFHSSYSLHWLSQAPRGLCKGAKLVNKGNIYITKASHPAVRKVYHEQFQEDFKLFLRLRSEELIVPGGAMALTFIATDENREATNGWALIGDTLNDMVLEGLVEEEKLDSFNMPSYCATETEVREIIEEEGSFNLERLQITKTGWHDYESSVSDINVSANRVAKFLRAVTESLLKEHFGEEFMDELFLRFKNKVVQTLMVEKVEVTNLVIYITNKASRVDNMDL
ncbi:hypothetical protein L6164_033258 [Bauhinia variegata]|uniref:Uncharacterized protein n=1 Tax=Bauhinia variegata TaxID=167791 RepID=A0ACB9KRE6_BAUVA|nr:hypothetical protein L6164_033258 [Bauhinia variegata]